MNGDSTRSNPTAAARRNWDTDAHDDLSAEVWHSAWLWIVLGAVAIVAVEVFDAAAGVVVLSLKFGWNDWAAAIWLVRTDPVPRRGRSCFWFQIALGFWKVCAWSFALVFSVAIVMAAIEGQRQNGQPLPKHFIAALMTWTISLAMATAITWFAVISAWTNRVLVWTDSSVAKPRHRESWPPPAGGSNSVRRMLIGGLTIPTTIASVVGLVTVINLLQQALGGPAGGPNAGAHPWEPIIIGGASVLTIVAPAFFVLVGTEWIGRRIAATSPVDCWPELNPPASGRA